MGNFLANLKGKLGRTELVLKKNSPDIMIVAGAVGVVASVVLACKATLKAELKVDEIKKERQDKLDEIEECRKEVSEESYTEEDEKKDKMIVNLRSFGKLAKTYAVAYAPAAITLGVSLGLIFKAHGILKARNAAIGAAYAAIDSAFKKYRERTVAKFGEAVDRELRYGLKEEELQVKDGDDEKTEKVVTADISSEYSLYARVFDEASRRWQNSAEYNLLFLREAQSHFNDLLNSRGHLFLNEVYDYLDLPRTEAGQFVGWLKDGKGDCEVDMGIYDVTNERHRAFINGYEKNIILDFNVDGIIYDKIEKKVSSKWKKEGAE